MSTTEEDIDAFKQSRTALRPRATFGYKEGAFAEQIGGDHYKEMAIQPVEYIHRNGIGFLAGNVIKYISRYATKNGLEDLEKAKHYIELLLECEKSA